MPKEVFGKDYPYLPHSQMLCSRKSRGWRRFSRTGIEKIRLTGGEPLLRRNIERLIEMLAAITCPTAGASSSR